MLARKRLNQVSDKRRADNQAWLRLRQRRLDHDNGQCQAADKFPDVECWGRLEVHHVLPRSRGPLLADLDDLRTVCARHHLYLDLHPLEAKEAGLLK